eukprot:3733130-Rhodomonas_salina.2
MSSHTALENLKQRLVSLQGSPSTPSGNDWDDNRRTRDAEEEYGRRTGAATSIGVNEKIRSRGEYGDRMAAEEDDGYSSGGRRDASSHESFDELEGRSNNAQLLQSKLKVAVFLLALSKLPGTHAGWYAG